MLISVEFEPAGVSLVLFFKKAHAMFQKKGFSSWYRAVNCNAFFTAEVITTIVILLTRICFPIQHKASEMQNNECGFVFPF